MLLVLLYPLLWSLPIDTSSAFTTGDCGFRYEANRFEPTIVNGTATKSNEFPWHVAIYRSNEKNSFNFICGGSIIDSLIVVTAAHCVYDEGNEKIDDRDFVVIVGKYHRSWDVRDPYEKRFKVIRIKIRKTYLGEKSRYHSDIALLALNEAIEFNSLIMPICIDWNGSFESRFENQTGLLAGWGLTENDTLSDTLLQTRLRLLDFTDCRKTISQGFTQFVTSDKFCTVGMNLGQVDRGDAGGGLVLPVRNADDNPQYFLQGILSGRDMNATDLATFTDVSSHLTWLNSTRKNLRAELTSTKVDHHIAVSSTPTAKDCGFRYETNRFQPTIVNGTATKSNEFPWHVAIYRSNEKNSFDYICGGTIIDSLIVVTAANCVFNEDTDDFDEKDLVVIVGKYHRSWEVTDPHEKRYKVIRKKIRKTYLGEKNRYEDDIALLALNETVKFNSLVMPICIDWNGSFESRVENQTGLLAGWGFTENDTLSDTLRQIKLRPVDFTECHKMISEGYASYVTSDKFCTVALDLGQVERGDGGGGLVFPVRNADDNPQYYLQGILSGRDKNATEYATFTDVSLHLTWLNSTRKNLRAELTSTKGSAQLRTPEKKPGN